MTHFLQLNKDTGLVLQTRDTKVFAFKTPCCRSSYKGPNYEGM